MGTTATTLTTELRPLEQKRQILQRQLANPDVKRWFDNLYRGSPLTATKNLYRLAKFCENHTTTPIELLDLARKDKLTISDLLQDHVTLMEEQGNAPSYMQGIVQAVKSWLNYFDIDIHRRIKVANADTTPTLDGERVPTADELLEIQNRASLRDGAAISLISKAGLRPEVLANWNATDGLTIKDLPDLVIHQGQAKFIQIPPIVIVRKTISKARHQYFTFFTTLAAKRLIAYLNDRLLSGTPFTPDTPVIAPDHRYHFGRGNNIGKPFLTTRHLCRAIRQVLRPRFQFRPYVFRAFFDTQLLIAESRGKVAHDFRVFWMGHKGSIEAKYTTNKGMLPKALLEEMREAFRRSEEYLDIEAAREDPTERQKEEVKASITKLTPDQLGKVQEMLRTLGIGNTNPSSG